MSSKPTHHQEASTQPNTGVIPAKVIIDNRSKGIQTVIRT